MKWLNRYSLTMAAAAVGLAVLPGIRHNLASAANSGADINRLGISEFRVHQTASELQIVGLDSRNAQVGKLSLRVSDVGRNLTVEVRGRKAWHESKGRAMLHLPLLSRKGMVDLNAFLLDSHVSSALHKWGIALGPQPGSRAADTPSHECTFAESPAAMGTSCCEMPALVPGAVEEFVCIGERENHGFVDRICTKPMDPNNPCGQTGPNGCAICWTASFTNHCLTAVDPNESSRCAYDFR